MSSFFDRQMLEGTHTRLGAETLLKGEIKFKESMCIKGRFQGKISAEGFLYIEPGAEIEADIVAHDVVIDGTVRGNIEAKGVVEMLENARLYGNVRSEKLRIADGVIFEGRCEMIGKAEPADIFSLSPREQREEILKTTGNIVDR